MAYRLKALLEELYQTFDRRYLATDPLVFVHRYRDRADQEVVAFLSAGLAFGNVRSIQQSLSCLLEALGPKPSDFVLHFDPLRHAECLPEKVHRWIGRPELARALVVLREMLRRFGSLEAAFTSGYEPDEPTLEPGLRAFARLARSLEPKAPSAENSPGAVYFFPSPETGSACKRLNLFLRWMVRGGDGLDLGLWSSIPPSRLLIPLDVHVGRISRALGLTRLRTPGFSMVRQVTASLRRFDPLDPIKYDFALARLGILKWCPSRRTPGRCEACPLEEVCIL